MTTPTSGTYREKMQEVTQISNALQGNTSLDIEDAMRMFETAVRRLDECEEILRLAEGRFNELTATERGEVAS